VREGFDDVRAVLCVVQDEDSALQLGEFGELFSDGRCVVLNE